MNHSRSLETTRREAQREVNALAARLGELQAQANRLNALGDRLTRIAKLGDGEFDFERPVGVGGAEPSPRRIAEAEAALNGEIPGDAAFRAAAEAAAAAIEPLEDHQTTGEYRRDLVRAVVRRALENSQA